VELRKSGLRATAVGRSAQTEPDAEVRSLIQTDLTAKHTEHAKGLPTNALAVAQPTDGDATPSSRSRVIHATSASRLQAFGLGMKRAGFLCFCGHWVFAPLRCSA
jgi:hypothetical protein